MKDVPAVLDYSWCIFGDSRINIPKLFFTFWELGGLTPISDDLI